MTLLWTFQMFSNNLTNHLHCYSILVRTLSNILLLDHYGWSTRSCTAYISINNSSLFDSYLFVFFSIQHSSSRTPHPRVIWFIHHHISITFIDIHILLFNHQYQLQPIRNFLHLYSNVHVHNVIHTMNDKNFFQLIRSFLERNVSYKCVRSMVMLMLNMSPILTIPKRQKMVSDSFRRIFSLSTISLKNFKIEENKISNCFQLTHYKSVSMMSTLLCSYHQF